VVWSQLTVHLMERISLDEGIELMENLVKFKVTSMPDFFVDRIVRGSSLETVMNQISDKMATGGGSIRNMLQMEIRGGNSVNTSYALAKLGVNVELIVVADKLSENFLRNTFSGLSNVELSIVNGKPGYTVALEFPNKKRKVNIMLSDVGDVSDFGSDKLLTDSWNKINDSDLVAIFNWASNIKGTELADKVFTTANENNVITYFAPADLAERRVELSALFTILKKNLKILSLNENEARVLAKALSCEHLPLEYLSKDIIRAARNLNKRTTIGIDIHTPIGSASAHGEETFFEETYKISQNNCTGAGDVWDAANIGGYLLALDPNIRLKLANAAAGIYVSSKNMEAPSKEQLFAFFEGKSEEMDS